MIDAIFIGCLIDWLR